MSSPRMSSSQAVYDWTMVANLEDIPKRGSRRLHLQDKRIAVFRTSEDKVFALLDECPHKQGPLSEGIVHGDCVTCPLHNWVISLASGEAVGADEGRVTAYPTRVHNSQVMIGLRCD